RARTPQGSRIDEQARLVIGADGLHSLVARSVRAPTYAEHPALTCWYYAYWSDVPVSGAEIYARDRRTLFAFPTNDGLTCIATVWPHEEFADYRRDVERNYLDTIGLAPGLA